MPEFLCIIAFLLLFAAPLSYLADRIRPEQAERWAGRWFWID